MSGYYRDVEATVRFWRIYLIPVAVLSLLGVGAYWVLHILTGGAL